MSNASSKPANDSDATKAGISAQLDAVTITDYLTLKGDPFTIDESAFAQISAPVVKVELKTIPDRSNEVDPLAIRKAFELKAVFGRDIRRALINGKFYLVGDEIQDGVVLERIGQRMITVRIRNQLVTIKLDRD